MNAVEQELVQSCKKRLVDYYGPRFRGLILYGSMARGTADPESDIDLLVLLDDPFNYFAELEVLVGLVDDLQLSSDRYLSVRPVRSEDFEAGRIQLYRNARKEGVAI